jgi:hypothetical protein
LRQALRNREAMTLEAICHDLVQTTAEQVASIITTTGFGRRCQIGALILDNLFGGSRLAWRARSSSAHVSFRRLSELLQGKISKSELHRCVKTTLLCQDLQFLATSANLTVSHVDVVDGLPRQVQKQLLGEAESQGYSVRQLSERRRQLTSGSDRDARRRGRPSLSLPQSIVSRAANIVRILRQMEAELADHAGPDQPGKKRGADLGKCIDEIQECQLALARAVESWHARGASDHIAGRPSDLLLPLNARKHRLTIVQSSQVG